jgi:glycosyltransferase involved in cell wall biosynthesis
VVGSDSGEIPNVIGTAGVIFPEGDSAALRQQLQRLLDRPADRDALGAAGRTRALHHYTMAAVAQETVAFYERLYALCK